MGVEIKAKDISIEGVDNEGMEYLAMYIPTKEVYKRRLTGLSYLSYRDKEHYLNVKLAEWNRMSPGVWQYYTA